jgi:hypothetical protein
MSITINRVVQLFNKAKSDSGLNDSVLRLIAKALVNLVDDGSTENFTGGKTKEQLQLDKHGQVDEKRWRQTKQLMEEYFDDLKKMKKTKREFDDLPPDSLFHILPYLDSYEAVKISFLSKKYGNLIMHPLNDWVMWGEIMNKKFGTLINITNTNYPGGFSYRVYWKNMVNFVDELTRFENDDAWDVYNNQLQKDTELLNEKYRYLRKDINFAIVGMKLAWDIMNSPVNYLKQYEARKIIEKTMDDIVVDYFMGQILHLLSKNDNPTLLAEREDIFFNRICRIKGLKKMFVERFAMSGFGFFTFTIDILLRYVTNYDVNGVARLNDNLTDAQKEQLIRAGDLLSFRFAGDQLRTDVPLVTYLINNGGILVYFEEMSQNDVPYNPDVIQVIMDKATSEGHDSVFEYLENGELYPFFKIGEDLADEDNILRYIQSTVERNDVFLSALVERGDLTSFEFVNSDITSGYLPLLEHLVQINPAVLRHVYDREVLTDQEVQNTVLFVAPQTAGEYLPPVNPDYAFLEYISDTSDDDDD